MHERIARRRCRDRAPHGRIIVQWSGDNYDLCKKLNVRRPLSRSIAVQGFAADLACIVQSLTALVEVAQFLCAILLGVCVHGHTGLKGALCK